MRPTLLCSLIILALLGCGGFNMRGNLDESITQYNDLLRKHMLDAASLFTTEALAREFEARAAAAKNMKMIDYRIVAVKYDEKKGEAEARVEIDYYSLSTYRMKTLTDNQKWTYLEERGSKQWRLTSPLPEFK
jgi:hypothetical protein